MEESRSHFRLGLFVFVALTTFAALLFILGGRSLFQPKFVFETYFDTSVAGLDIGAPVQFRGVPLGQVTEIVTSGAVYESNVPFLQRRQYIVVRANVFVSKQEVEEIRRDSAEYVARGMRAQTQLAGITGQQYLALDFLDPDTYPPLPFDWKPNYPYIPSAPSLTSQIIENAQEFLANLNKADIQKLGQDLNRLVEDVNAKVDELPVDELSADVLDGIKEIRGTVNRINDILAKGDVELTLRNLNTASGRIDALLARPDINQTLANAAALTGGADALIADNQYDLRTIVEDLRVTAENLRVVSETVKRYPAGALVGGPPEKVPFPRKSR
jgi:phospholipid/cholesterol/gamma-HCH transport system substrate-binding protein/paraquat-inducible protein B